MRVYQCGNLVSIGLGIHIIRPCTVETYWNIHVINERNVNGAEQHIIIIMRNQFCQALDAQRLTKSTFIASCELYKTRKILSTQMCVRLLQRVSFITGRHDDFSVYVCTFLKNIFEENRFFFYFRFV